MTSYVTFPQRHEPLKGWSAIV